MENIFVDGIFIQKPSEKAPKWVKLNFSVNVKEFTMFAEAHKNALGYLNFDLKRGKEKDGKEGNLYLALNTFELKKNEEI